MKPDDREQDAAMHTPNSLYRQAGFDESPPREIDTALLDAAARAAAQRRRRLRPTHFAWAAAVALSIALVIEVGIRPTPSITGAHAPQQPEQIELRAQPPGASGTRAREFAADSIAVDVPAQGIASDSTVPRAASETGAAEAASDTSAPGAAAVTSAPEVSDTAASRAASDTSARRAARDTSASRAASDTSAPGRAAETASADAALYERAAKQNAPAADEAALRCGPAVRDSSTAWFDCINALRRAGDDAGAAAELEALRRRYPEAVPPAEVAPH